jgi:outer membrane protein
MRTPLRAIFCPIVAVLAAAIVLAQPLTLTLSQAVELAIKNNLQTLLAQERIAEARGQRGVGFSALLPNISGAASQANLTSNLAALGLPIQSFPGIQPFVGPFSRFDARFQLFQSVFNLAAIRRYQAGGQAVQLAQHEQRLAVEHVTTAAAIAYLTVLEAQEAVSAAQANAQLAQRLLDLANSQKSAGVATGLDVARAETRLANQQVQVAQARTNLDTARLNLLRVIGAPLATEVMLAEKMQFQPETLPDAGGAVAKALSDRVEIEVANDQVRIADTQRRAAFAGYLPSVGFFGDYGMSGLRPDQIDLPTRTVGLQLNVPVFNGGRTRSEVQIAGSRERQAELQRNDLRAAVEKDVRQALDNLATREEQVRAAQKAVTLAQRELELSQDRFKNGVADNIEVVNAQTALENARLVLVASLAQFNAARLNLQAALGHAEDFKL